MNNGNPTGEVRPMIDREPPNAAETRGASVRTRFCETSGAGSSPRSLAHRSGTAHCRVSEAGNWGISDNHHARSNRRRCAANRGISVVTQLNTRRLRINLLARREPTAPSPGRLPDVR